MYFLSSGILFGFKKPVLYFPIEEIHSMSVQTITGRTFCLVLSSSNGESVEFDMIDITGKNHGTVLTNSQNEVFNYLPKGVYFAVNIKNNCW